jgi:transcriptional regulator with XRE-family HTH domain
MSAQKIDTEAVVSEVGQNIRAARKKAGMSQEQVAKGAGIHRTEVGLLERGLRMPRADTLIKVAGAIGLDAAVFLRGITWTPEQQATKGGHFSVSPSKND